MEYELVWVREHIEVYDGAGRFCFSADNEREAREEQVWISSGLLSLSTMVRMTWGTYCLHSRAKSSMA